METLEWDEGEERFTLSQVVSMLAKMVDFDPKFAADALRALAERLKTIDTKPWHYDKEE